MVPATEYTYQLSLINPRGGIVLDDHCDKLAVDRRSSEA